MPLLRYHASMPAPTNERQALERERDELPAHVANYQRELDATPQQQRERPFRTLAALSGDCGNIDEAIEIASKHPMARFGKIEIRPLWITD